MALAYLTLQDVQLLHFMLTKERSAFDALRLEEAVFYQYAPGGGADLARQGSRFLSGFVAQAPFQSGNEACAFAGLLAFLEINGRSLGLSDDQAPAWVRPLFGDRELAEEAIRERLIEVERRSAYGVPDVEEVCEGILSRFAKTLAGLAPPASVAS